MSERSYCRASQVVDARFHSFALAAKSAIISIQHSGRHAFCPRPPRHDRQSLQAMPPEMFRRRPSRDSRPQHRPFSCRTAASVRRAFRGGGRCRRRHDITGHYAPRYSVSGSQRQCRDFANLKFSQAILPIADAHTPSRFSPRYGENFTLRAETSAISYRSRSA